MTVIYGRQLKKEIGLKVLYENADFEITKGERIGLIGRNGYGKTTLFRILAGLDKEFEGDLYIDKSLSIVLTNQEYFLDDKITAIEYILNNVPKYNQLKDIIKEYESNGDEKISLELYCDAVQEFSDLGYYEIENDILSTLSSFQVDMETILKPFMSLSGGQKRFIELTKVIFSKADIQLIDEPTNHMDYAGKENFINWLKKSKETQIIVSHDRDVLNHVDRILEVKNKTLVSYSGNYEKYIKQNTSHNITQITQYENDLRQLDRAKKQMIAARDHKFRAKSTKARTAALIQEKRFTKQFEKLQNDLSKPAFWIDKNSINEVDSVIVNSYEKFKEKNISITTKSVENHKRNLIKIRNISLGYKEPLFKKLNIDINEGERLFIKGRNGRGKTTLIKSIITADHIQNPYKKSLNKNFYENSQIQIFEGEIICNQRLVIGIYEQEINEKYLDLTLREAVREVMFELDIPGNDEKINQLLGNYLFDPIEDGKIKISSLSGGQKARFQIIKMLINNPNLLILDEPTNHLDLPSIEELEDALKKYTGGIIYISHDSVFIDEIGGLTIELDKLI